MKILALDGNSIINRAFYGIRLLTTKDGVFTNAVYGFINILNRILADETPDGVVVAFDVHAPTFRHKEYAEYKAGRKGMPEELRSQMPLLKEWLNCMGYKIIEIEGYEADDILGSVAALCENTGNECVIATGDRDALQLISDSTRVLLTATKMGRPEHTNYNKQALFERYGLTPAGMLELKALMGDSSDNIPGVTGVGEKTATDLITRFESIDNIYNNLETLDIKDAVKQKLIAGKQSAYLSRWLGQICKTAPIDSDINAYLPAQRNDSALAEFLTRLEFFKMLQSLGLTPQKSSPDQTNDFTVVSPAEFKIQDCLDILPDYQNKKVAILSGSSIAEFDLTGNKELAAALESNAKKRIYDYKNFKKWLINNNITCQNIVFDSMLAAYLANPSASNYQLDRLIGEYGGGVGVNTQNEFLNSAVAHSTVCNNLYKELEQKKQLDLLCNIEIPLSEVLAEMELNGFLIDADGIAEYGAELAERIAKIEAEIYSLVGYEFNLNSPKQLGVALFEKLGLPAKKKTKSGYSTSADVLEELKEIHPSVKLLLEYRGLAKLKSTYCDGLCAAAGPDGRIHSTFNQTETRTGRISSLEPNLQNIPVRTPEGKKLRKYFKAPSGYTLCDADYSQIELRVLAHISGDQNMINAFKNDIDIHALTASTAFNMPLDMVTDQMRSRAKAVNFGIVYGIGAFSLAKDIGVTRKEAESYINGYLAAYPAVDNYMKNIIEQAKQDGYVLTLFGRRRYLPELSSSNGMLRAFGERVARNAPIQGTAADIIKIAMVRVSRRLKQENLNARLILQVHDELIVECEEGIKQTVCNILKEEMAAAANMSVSLTVDANSGQNWFIAKG